MLCYVIYYIISYIIYYIMLCYVVMLYYIMGSPSYMRSVADRNVVMRRMTTFYPVFPDLWNRIASGRFPGMALSSFWWQQHVDVDSMQQDNDRGKPDPLPFCRTQISYLSLNAVVSQSKNCPFPVNTKTELKNITTTLGNTAMRRITTFRSTTDRIHDGCPIRYHNITL